MDHIDIYVDCAGEARWRCVAANGETVAVGEGYTRRASAKRAARRLFPDVPIRHIRHIR